MKQFLRPVGQCLTTAVITSTLLETYVLPAPGNANPESPNGQSIEEVSAPTPQETAPQPRAEELIAPPETLGFPERTTTPAEALPPHTSEILPHADAVVTPNLADLEDTHPDTAISEPSSLATEAIADPEALETVRQLLEEKLAALVERDKPAKIAQFQTNLVASALGYAEAGDFERARLTAQHPALPVEIQTETLAKIDEIQQVQQPGSVQAEEQAIATAQPSTVVSSLSPRSASFPPSYRPVGYAGRICQNPIAAAAQPKLDPTAVLKLATHLSQVDLIEVPATADLNSLPAPFLKDFEVATNQIELGQLPTPMPTEQVSVLTQSELDLASRLQTQRPVSFQTSGDRPVNLKMGHIVSSTLVKWFDEADAVIQPRIPSVIQSALGWWTKPQVKTVHWEQPTAKQPNDVGLVLTQPDGGDRLPLAASHPSVEHRLRESSREQNLALSKEQNLALSKLQLEPPSASVALPVPLDGITPDAIPALGRSSLLEVGQEIVVDLDNVPSSVGKLGKGVSPKSWQSEVKTAALATQTDSQNFDCSYGTGALGMIYRVHSLLAEQLDKLGMVFPLPIPASITSAFGWRIHPITGDRRFHEGIDFGAPYGTPVLAADAGQVVVADRMGGYGLAVVIENDQVSRRNLYAHLSNIAVQPGTRVEKGTVIGWVGSTGNSTGPHLHFEVQYLTSNGWAAIDPVAFAARASAIR
jgi:murein DD-endopeptidase MepM/ murein hydrolase activator NlpD